jgi:hypothetical protein
MEPQTTRDIIAAMPEITIDESYTLAVSGEAGPDGSVVITWKNSLTDRTENVIAKKAELLDLLDRVGMLEAAGYVKRQGA